MSFTIHATAFVGTYNGTLNLVTGLTGWDGTGTDYTVTIDSSGNFFLSLESNPDTFVKNDSDMNWALVSSGGTVYASDPFPNAISDYTITIMYDVSRSDKRFWITWESAAHPGDIYNTYAYRGGIPMPIFDLSQTMTGVYTGTISSGDLAGSFTLTAYPTRLVFSQPTQTPVTFEGSDMEWVLGSVLGENTTRTLTTTYRGNDVILAYHNETSPPGFTVYFYETGTMTGTGLVVTTRSAPLPGGSNPTPIPNPTPTPTTPTTTGTSRTWIWIIVGIVALILVVVVVIVIVVIVSRSRAKPVVIQQI